MPVYEFYCADCHAIFNFITNRIDTSRRPGCPRCGRPELERQVSPFAISKNRQAEATEAGPAMADLRMEQAMLSLADDMAHLDEEDPRAMARFMRRLTDMAGVGLGDKAEEALSRLEAGDDPEQVEADLGDVFGDDDMLSKKRLKSFRRKHLPPEQDDTLYRLD